MRRRQTHSFHGTHEDLSAPLLQSARASEQEEQDAATLERALGHYEQLRFSASQAFDANTPEHVQIMTDLWGMTFGAAAFERTSERWKALGFQGTDPATDLRATGVLGLMHLQRFVASGGLPPGTPKDFPLAIASINVTGALNRVLHLNTTVVIPGAPQPAEEAVLEAFMRCLSTQRNTLQTLHDRLLLHLARRWQLHTEAAPAATIMEFPVVLHASFSHLSATLAAAPRPWHLPTLAGALLTVPVETPALAFAFGVVLWVWSHICSCGSSPPPPPPRGAAPDAASRRGWAASASSVKIS